MLILQLAIIGLVQASEAYGTTDAAEVQANSEQLLSALEARLDASEAKVREETDRAVRAERTAASNGQELQAEQEKNAKWHEVASTLQDQVQAAEDAKAASAAKASRATAKAAQDEATVRAEAKVAAEAQAALHNIGNTDDQRVQQTAAAAAADRARAEKAEAEKAVAETAAKSSAAAERKLRADLERARDEEAQQAAHLATAEAAQKQLEAGSDSEMKSARNAAAQAAAEAAFAKNAEAQAIRLKKVVDEKDDAMQAAQASTNKTAAEKAQLARVLKSKLNELASAEDAVVDLKKKAVTLGRKLSQEEKRTSQEASAEKQAGEKARQADVAREAAEREAVAQAAMARNATEKTTAAKAAAEEAVAAAKESHRALLQRLHEIADLQDTVSLLQGRVANATRGEMSGSYHAKLALHKEEAATAGLKQENARLTSDLKAAKSAETTAEDKASKAEAAAAKATQAAYSEARMVDSAKRAVAIARSDAVDTQTAKLAGDVQVGKLQKQAEEYKHRIMELQEDLDIRVRAEENFRNTVAQSNSSLTDAKKQVNLLQTRAQSLEQLGAREAAMRKEAEEGKAAAEVEEDALRRKIEALQDSVKKSDAQIESVRSSAKQAESNENEYFDSMTALQTAKDDLTQQLADATTAGATAQKKADDLEKTNEYLRGEQQSTDQAGQAAMSDYLKEIEGMKMEEERLQSTIGKNAVDTAQLHSAVTDLWNELTPAQRKDLAAKTKAKKGGAAAAAPARKSNLRA